MSNSKKLKQFPKFETDEDAERFVDEADLSEYDFSEFRPANFEFQRKEARVNMRLPQKQLELIKTAAKKRKIPYQRFMRELIERGMHTLKL